MIKLTSYGCLEMCADGNWPGPLHNVTSRDAALKLGMSQEDAIKLGNAVENVDSIMRGKSWMPILGDQGYHFNTNKDNPGAKDSRLIRHEKHFSKAVAWGKRANNMRSDRDGIVASLKNKMADIMKNISINHLGMSLHPKQDTDAHSDEYSKKLLGVHYHDQPAFGTIDLADNPENKPERYENTQRVTNEVISSYLDKINE